MSKSTRPRFCSSIKKIIKASEKTCHYEKQNKQTKKKTDEKTSKKFINEKNVAHIFVT